MDVMCGKGQDLARAIDIGYEEIIAVDRDTDAIYELLQRKHNLRVKSKNAIAKIHVKRVDLEEPSSKIIHDLKIKKEYASAAMLNFGIHYICHDTMSKESPEPPLIEFIKLMSYYLKSKGKLMITCFNGETIFNMLKDSPEWNLFEDKRLKYSIKKKYISDTITDMNQPIDVLLPFSNGEYYTEYLVNISYLETVFKEHGFKMIVNEGFDNLFRQFKKTNMRVFAQLSKEDKEFISLYQYLVFEKL
jgi:SAM-dependent methyltransferase